MKNNAPHYRCEADILKCGSFVQWEMISYFQLIRDGGKSKIRELGQEFDNLLFAHWSTAYSIVLVISLINLFYFLFFVIVKLPTTYLRVNETFIFKSILFDIF